MQILTQRLTFNARGRDMCPDTIHRKHQKGKYDPFPEFGNVEYILNSRKHRLDHLGLSAGCLNFLDCTLAELVCAHCKL